MKRYAGPLALFGLFTAVGLLFFTSDYMDDLARQHYGTVPTRLLEEMTGAYTAFALLPFAIWVARRFRITRETWLTMVPATLVGALVFSVAHTSLMAITRSVLSPLLGMGAYHYGIMLFRYPMEAAKDILFFMVGVGCVNAIDRFAQARQAETKLAQAQLENLKLQLQPHFLFNTLNAISAVMYEDVGKADRMLTKLSDFMRTVLDSSGVHEVSLGEELRVEQMYVDIMKTRLERGLHLDVRVDQAAQDAAVPFMLLQPLLENSIRHGMDGTRSSLELGIAVHRKNGTTVIDVSDDGSGFDDRASRGIGLRNVESRLLHMYGDAASFSIGARADGGTLATITLPYVVAGAR